MTARPCRRRCCGDFCRTARPIRCRFVGNPGRARNLGTGRRGLSRQSDPVFRGCSGCPRTPRIFQGMQTPFETTLSATGRLDYLPPGGRYLKSVFSLSAFWRFAEWFVYWVCFAVIKSALCPLPSESWFQRFSFLEMSVVSSLAVRSLICFQPFSFSAF